jgi:hypothetical protein
MTKYKDLEKRAAYVSQWNADNKDKRREYRKKWVEGNGPLYLLIKAQNRARQQNLAFDLEIGDIVIPETCPYLGIPLVLELGKGQTPNSPSIDRVDNSKGYTKDNIQIISRKANTMKSNATKDELVAFAQEILRVFTGA